MLSKFFFKQKLADQLPSITFRIEKNLEIPVNIGVFNTVGAFGVTGAIGVF